MASSFNLTAQLNLVGPTNVKKIASEIRRELGAIDANVKIKIDSTAASNAAKINKVLQQLNNTLLKTQSLASSASTSLSQLGGSVSSVNLGKFNADTQQSVKSIDNIGTVSSKSAKDVGIMSTELAEFGRQSGLAIRRFAAFSIVSSVVYKLNNALSGAINNFIDFDKELVRVAQVTGKNIDELGGLVNEITKLSTSLGVTSEDLIQVSSTLAQAGLSAGETEQALKALALSANAPSFDSLNDTVEGSIALMRQFGIKAKDLEQALGSINAVSAQFAVEASDIITAIQRTGGVFATASKGVSSGTDALNEFIAVFTSVRATTRESAETIATGLRTIFARIQRGDTIEQLKQFGVVLTDLEGKFVGPYEAIRRLSEGLSALDPRDLSFSKIVEELGGFRQIGKVIPLIQQFATAQDALKVAQQGAGSLADDNAKAQLALANKLTKLREEFVSLIREVGKNSVFQGFLNVTLSLTGAILKLIRAGKGLFPILTVIGGMKAISGITQFAGGFAKGVRPKKTGETISGNIGENIGEILTGAKNEKESASLEAASETIDKATADLAAQIASAIPIITQLSSVIQQQLVEISANTAALSTNTASIDALTQAISSTNFGGGTSPTGIKDGGRIFGFAKGGTVPGYGNNDTVPAMLTPGEFVMRKDAVKGIGANNLHKMNKYAGGGLVKDLVDKSTGGKPLVKEFYDTMPQFDTYSAPNIQRVKLVKSYQDYEDEALDIWFEANQIYRDDVKSGKYKPLTDERGKTASEPPPRPNDYIKSKIGGTQSTVQQLGFKELRGNRAGEPSATSLNKIRGALAERDTEQTFTKSLERLPNRLGADYYSSKANTFGDVKIPANSYVEVKNQQNEVKDNTLIAKALLAYAGKQGGDKSFANEQKDNVPKLNIVAVETEKMNTGGQIISNIYKDNLRFADGGIAEIENKNVSIKPPKRTFGTGEFKFPRRISNTYFKEIDKLTQAQASAEKFDRPLENDRINIDTSRMLEEHTKPFNKSLFIESFKQKVGAKSIFTRMAEFAKFIGLPAENLTDVLPQSIDFAPIGMSKGAFYRNPQGVLGSTKGIDLTPYGFSQKDKEDLYGYKKLRDDKNKELRKIIKTPVRMFDDGSFTYDMDAANKLNDEINGYTTKIAELENREWDSEKLAKQARTNIAEQTGRGVIALGPGGVFGNSPTYDTLYHEMTHQLFKSLRARSEDTFTKYRERVNQLFAGDNNQLADAFDILPGSSYSSADVVYGRHYKTSLLDNVLSDNSRKTADNPDASPLFDAQDYSFRYKSSDIKKAKDYAKINPKMNELLLRGGITQPRIDMAEDSGKEEFLTTLMQNVPTLDESMMSVLDSSISDLLSDAGIQRQKYNRGGMAEREKAIKTIKTRKQLQQYLYGKKSEQPDTLVGSNVRITGRLRRQAMKPGSFNSVTDFFPMGDEGEHIELDPSGSGKVIKDNLYYSDGGIAQRKVGYIDYDVIANPDNEATVKKGMEATGMSGPRLYTDYLAQLAVKARKESNLQKIRAIYGVAGSGKTTLARGQGTDTAKLRQTERFPILSPEDIQRSTEVLVLSSSVSKDKLDNLFSQVDKTYTLSSTTPEEKERVKSQRASRDITGVGLEGRTPGVTTGVGRDTAVSEALLSNRLGDRSVVLGRSATGRLQRKKGDELVEIVKKKLGITWGGFAPMTAGHESIMDAASAMGIPPEDFLFLVGANEGIKLGDPSSYRTAIFNQDARVLLAKAGAGAKGATVLPKAADFEVPMGFDISEETGRRKVLLPKKGSRVFVADKTEEQMAKYKQSGYDVTNLERTGGISGTMVRDFIEKGKLKELQKVLSPEVYELISNNIGRIQNRANILPSIIKQVQQSQTVKLADVEKSIKTVGISRVDKKKMEDPEYAAKVQILEELRKQRDKIKSAGAFEPYKLLDELAKSQPEKYGLDFTATQTPTLEPIRTIKRIQRANIGGIIQKFAGGGSIKVRLPNQPLSLKDIDNENDMAESAKGALKGLMFEKDFVRSYGQAAKPGPDFPDVTDPNIVKNIASNIYPNAEALELKYEDNQYTRAKYISSLKANNKTEDQIPMVVRANLGGKIQKFMAGGEAQKLMADELYDPNGERITRNRRDYMLSDVIRALRDATGASLNAEEAKEMFMEKINPSDGGFSFYKYDTGLLNSQISEGGISLPSWFKVASPRPPESSSSVSGWSEAASRAAEQKAQRQGLGSSAAREAGIIASKRTLIENRRENYRKRRGRYNSGGLIGDKVQKFMAGDAVEIDTEELKKYGTIGNRAEEQLISGKTTSIIEAIKLALVQQLSALGNEAGVIESGVVLPASMRRRLRKDNILNDKIDLLQASGIINEALSKKGTRNAAEEARIAKLRRVAVAGLLPIDYNKNFEWKLKDGKEIYASVRGFNSVFLDDIQQMQAETAAASQRFGENIQATAALGPLAKPSKIMGPIRPLAIDFDETLATGTKMVDDKGEEDLPAYADRNKVADSLQKAKPTALAKRLAKIEQDYPGYVRQYTRILTARPDSTKDLIANALNSFGLPYLPEDVTGLSQDVGPGRKFTSIAQAKGASVSQAEQLIDDSEANIKATIAAGKAGFLYGETKPITDPLMSEKLGQSNIEGAILEKALAEQLGYSINFDELERNRSIDFPNGLGRAAQYFGLDPNIETEVKRTLDGSSFEKVREEYSRYFTENPDKYNLGGIVQKFNTGGKASLDDVRKNISEQYPDYKFRINPKSSGFGYRMLVSSASADAPKSEMAFDLFRKLSDAPLLAEKLIGRIQEQQKTRNFASGGEADSLSEKSKQISEKKYGKIRLKDLNSGYTGSISASYMDGEGAGEVYAQDIGGGLYSVASSSATQGYGPRLYDVIMESVTQSGNKLVSDRSRVSNSAKRVWEYYLTKRGDVEKTPITDISKWYTGPQLDMSKFTSDDPKTWPPYNDIAWALNTAYAKRPSLINDKNIVQRFADGGSIPALVSNGEAFVPPKLARSIGYGTLNRMNQADRNGMGKFSSGGISIFKGPGTGTSDSIRTNLPVGSFIIREKATKALGLNKGGSVGNISKFAVGGSVVGAKDLERITAAGLQITSSLSAEIKDKLLAFVGRFSKELPEPSALDTLDEAKVKFINTILLAADDITDLGDEAYHYLRTAMTTMVEEIDKISGERMAAAPKSVPNPTMPPVPPAPPGSGPPKPPPTFPKPVVSATPPPVPPAPPGTTPRLPPSFGNKTFVGGPVPPLTPEEQQKLQPQTPKKKTYKLPGKYEDIATAASFRDQQATMLKEAEAKQSRLGARKTKLEAQLSAATTPVETALLQSEINKVTDKIEKNKAVLAVFASELESKEKNFFAEFDALTNAVKQAEEKETAAREALDKAYAKLVKQVEKAVGADTWKNMTKEEQLAAISEAAAKDNNIAQASTVLARAQTDTAKQRVALQTRFGGAKTPEELTANIVGGTVAGKAQAQVDARLAAKNDAEARVRETGARRAKEIIGEKRVGQTDEDYNKRLEKETFTQTRKAAIQSGMVKKKAVSAQEQEEIKKRGEKSPFDPDTFVVPFASALQIMEDNLKESSNMLRVSFEDVNGNVSKFGKTLSSIPNTLAGFAGRTANGLKSLNDQFTNTKLGGFFQGLNSLKGFIGGFITTAGLSSAAESAGGYQTTLGTSLNIASEVAEFSTSIGTATAGFGPFGVAIGTAIGALAGLGKGLYDAAQAAREEKVRLAEIAKDDSLQKATQDFDIFFESAIPDAKDLESGLQNLSKLIAAENDIIKNSITSAERYTLGGFGPKRKLEGSELAAKSKEIAAASAGSASIAKSLITRTMQAGNTDIEGARNTLGAKQFDSLTQQMANADAIYIQTVIEAQRTYADQIKQGTSKATAEANYYNAIGAAKDSVIQRALAEQKAAQETDNYRRTVTDVRKGLESTGVSMLEKIIGNTPEENKEYAKSLNTASALLEGNAASMKASETQAYEKAYATTNGTDIDRRRAGESAAANVRQRALADAKDLISMMPDTVDKEGRSQRRLAQATLLETQLKSRGVDTGTGLAKQVLDSLRQADPEKEFQKKVASDQLKQLEIIAKNTGSLNNEPPKPTDQLGMQQSRTDAIMQTVLGNATNLAVTAGGVSNTISTAASFMRGGKTTTEAAQAANVAATAGKAGTTAATAAGGVGAAAAGGVGGAATTVAKTGGFGLKAAGGILGKALAPLGFILGGVSGAMEAKDANRTTAEGSVYGALTGGAQTGSFITGKYGKEAGTVDKALGVAGAAGAGALSGAAIGSFVPVIGTAIGAVVGAITGGAAELLKIFTEGGVSIKDAIANIGSAIWSGIKNLGSFMYKTGLSAIDGLWSGLKALPGFIYESAMSAFGMIWKGISTVVPAVIDGIIFAFNGIGKFLGEAGYAAVTTIVEVFQGIPSFITETIPAALVAGGNALVDSLISFGGWVYDQFVRIFSNIGNAINDAVYGLVKRVGGETAVKYFGLKPSEQPQIIAKEKATLDKTKSPLVPGKPAGAGIEGATFIPSVAKDQLKQLEEIANLTPEQQKQQTGTLTTAQTNQPQVNVQDQIIKLLQKIEENTRKSSSSSDTTAKQTAQTNKDLSKTATGKNISAEDMKNMEVKAYEEAYAKQGGTEREKQIAGENAAANMRKNLNTVEQPTTQYTSQVAPPEVLTSAVTRALPQVSRSTNALPMGSILNSTQQLPSTISRFKAGYDMGKFKIAPKGGSVAAKLGNITQRVVSGAGEIGGGASQTLSPLVQRVSTGAERVGGVARRALSPTVNRLKTGYEIAQMGFDNAKLSRTAKIGYKAGNIARSAYGLGESAINLGSNIVSPTIGKLKAGADIAKMGGVTTGLSTTAKIGFGASKLGTLGMGAAKLAGKALAPADLLLGAYTGYKDTKRDAADRGSLERIALGTLTGSASTGGSITGKIAGLQEGGTADVITGGLEAAGRGAMIGAQFGGVPGAAVGAVVGAGAEVYKAESVRRRESATFDKQMKESNRGALLTKVNEQGDIVSRQEGNKVSLSDFKNLSGMKLQLAQSARENKNEGLAQQLESGTLDIGTAEGRGSIAQLVDKAKIKYMQQKKANSGLFGDTFKYKEAESELARYEGISKELNMAGDITSGKTSFSELEAKNKNREDKKTKDRAKTTAKAMKADEEARKGMSYEGKLAATVDDSGLNVRERLHLREAQGAQEELAQAQAGGDAEKIAKAQARIQSIEEGRKAANLKETGKAEGSKDLEARLALVRSGALPQVEASTEYTAQRATQPQVSTPSFREQLNQTSGASFTSPDRGPAYIGSAPGIVSPDVIDQAKSEYLAIEAENAKKQAATNMLNTNPADIYTQATQSATAGISPVSPLYALANQTLGGSQIGQEMNTPVPSPGGVSINTAQPRAAGTPELGNMANIDPAAISEALAGTFNNFITALQNIQLPKIPDTITMEGRHTVEVIINGADALKSIDEGIRNMVTDKINEQMKKLSNKTEGGL